MRKWMLIAGLACGLSVCGLGCQGGGSADKASNAKGQPGASDSRSKASPTEVRTERSAGSRAPHTASNNPTTAGGRGSPALDDPERPAAWVFVDGQSGKFNEHEGHKQIEWTIEKPVSAAPTFRVEVYEPLLGSPGELKYILKSVEASDGSELSYAVSSTGGSFAPGKDYELLNPGPGFQVRNWATGDVVSEISPLPPGTYVLAAKIGKGKDGREAAAVTYFTVADGG